MCHPTYSMGVCREDETPRPGSSGYRHLRLKISQWTVSQRNTWEGPVPRFIATAQRNQIHLAPADFPRIADRSKSSSLLVLPGKTPTLNLAEAARSRRKGS